MFLPITKYTNPSHYCRKLLIIFVSMFSYILLSKANFMFKTKVQLLLPRPPSLRPSATLRTKSNVAVRSTMVLVPATSPIVDLPHPCSFPSSNFSLLAVPVT